MTIIHFVDCPKITKDKSFDASLTSTRFELKRGPRVLN